jgi:aspartate/methionine/tyrosine aminotransferase
MTEADRLNAVLERDAPALARCLSPLGRKAAFPKGIPYQAATAKGTEINATIGQLTDGSGEPMPLPQLARQLSALDAREAFLYAPVSGPEALRTLWGARERRLGGVTADVRSTKPLVTHGLTHGLSLVADLFSDEDTDIIVPSPSWENYGLLFSLHRDARIVEFPFFRDGRFNVEGLSDALAKVRHKAVVILNLPGNPSGYAPTDAEVPQIIEALAGAPKPTLVAVDDAYQGWVYERGHLATSLFWKLAERLDPDKVAAVKIDGATKELAFFASRVGFLTFPHTTDEAESALESKLKCITRGTVGSASGPAMAVVTEALRDPDLDAAFEERRQQLAERYQALRDALGSLHDERVTPLPFNAAYFALLQLSDGLDAEALRRDLIANESVGTIAFPEANALRIAYCSLDASQLPELVQRLGRSLKRA